MIYELPIYAATDANWTSEGIAANRETASGMLCYFLSPDEMQNCEDVNMPSCARNHRPVLFWGLTPYACILVQKAERSTQMPPQLQPAHTPVGHRSLQIKIAAVFLGQELA